MPVSNAQLAIIADRVWPWRTSRSETLMARSKLASASKQRLMPFGHHPSGGPYAAVGLFTPDLGEVARWRAEGASLFLLGSDQGFLRSGALDLRRSCCIIPACISIWLRTSTTAISSLNWNSAIEGRQQRRPISCQQHRLGPQLEVGFRIPDTGQRSR